MFDFRTRVASSHPVAFPFGESAAPQPRSGALPFASRLGAVDACSNLAIMLTLSTSLYLVFAATPRSFREAPGVLTSRAGSEMNLFSRPL